MNGNITQRLCVANFPIGDELRCPLMANYIGKVYMKKGVRAKA